MAQQKTPKTWAEEIAKLDDPTPRDFDPEDANEEDSNGEEEVAADDTVEARRHYLDVGKSKLRKPGTVSLGPQYRGSHISRDTLFEQAGSSDDDSFASARRERDGSNDVGPGKEHAKTSLRNAFRGSRMTQQEVSGHHREDAEVEDDKIREDSNEFSDMESDDSNTTDMLDGVKDSPGRSPGPRPHSPDSANSAQDIEMSDLESLPSKTSTSHSTASSSYPDDDQIPAPPLNNDDDDHRAALRQILAESQKTTTANLSKAVKSDIAKGRAIKRQRATFDSLLNIRIRIQKALVAVDSLQPASSSPPASNTDDPKGLEAAEQSALSLWSALGSLRQSLYRPMPKPSPPLEGKPPLSTLWTHMQHLETQSHPSRTATLNKWSARTAPLPTQTTNKFSPSTSKPPLPFSTLLHQTLSSPTTMEELISKSTIPSSSSSSQPHPPPPQPQQQQQQNPPPPPSLKYHDSDFYALLLRDLLASQATTSHQHPLTSSTFLPTSSFLPTIKPPRIRKKPVDTKASKGRKIRYTVHEKLQNFMAREERGTWGGRRREEFLRGLLGGGGGGGGEVERGGEEEEEDGDGDEVEEGFRFF
ncbi:MAG: hypothetical protein Q9219_000410 [cf. Caloplaca sp. 3 TL-2023]